MKKTLKNKKLRSLEVSRLEDREAPALTSYGTGSLYIQPNGTKYTTGSYEDNSAGCNNWAGSGASGTAWSNSPNTISGVPTGCEGTTQLDAAPEFMAAGNTYSPNACYSTTNFYGISACVA